MRSCRLVPGYSNLTISRITDLVTMLVLSSGLKWQPHGTLRGWNKWSA